jgi:hypothetical protein
MRILEAVCILLRATVCNLALVGCEPPGCQSTVRQEEHQHQRPYECDEAEYNKEPSPSSQSIVNFSDGISQDPTEDASEAVACEPDSMSQGMLGGLVPETSDQTEARTDNTFKNSKQYSEYHKGRKIRSCSVASEDDGPAADCRSQVFADRKLDETDRAWQAGNEVSKVECTASPRVLLTHQMLEDHHQLRQLRGMGNLLCPFEFPSRLYIQG